MKDKDSLDFVSRHYREDAFNASDGWKRLGIKRFHWSAFKIAASVGALVAVSATAAILFGDFKKADSDIVTTPGIEPIESESRTPIVRTIDFDDTPLPDVLKKISEVYSVSVVNLPEDAESFRLTLHYEGNAVDLIETINDILGTEMTVEK